ncbi:hypothetical protein OCEANICA350_11189 [Oceanicaulis sp. 350]|nr:hypothetical protein OCEANICA350_11189 [Oceanicaulis sp. 350]
MSFSALETACTGRVLAVNASPHANDNKDVSNANLYCRPRRRRAGFNLRPGAKPKRNRAGHI